MRGREYVIGRRKEKEKASHLTCRDIFSGKSADKGSHEGRSTYNVQKVGQKGKIMLL
jgi:hypothetical protein